jgi:hypothetical protein
MELSTIHSYCLFKKSVLQKRFELVLPLACPCSVPQHGGFPVLENYHTKIRLFEVPFCIENNKHI